MHFEGEKLLLIIIPTAIFPLAPHFSASPYINTSWSYLHSFATIPFFPVSRKPIHTQTSTLPQHCPCQIHMSWIFAAESNDRLNLSSFSVPLWSFLFSLTSYCWSVPVAIILSFCSSPSIVTSSVITSISMALNVIYEPMTPKLVSPPWTFPEPQTHLFGISTWIYNRHLK